MAAGPSSAATALAACVELRRDRPLLPRALAQGRPPSPAPAASRSIFLKKSNISKKWCNILQNVDKKVNETNISEKYWEEVKMLITKMLVQKMFQHFVKC
jgi:hypothetical protein